MTAARMLESDSVTPTPTPKNEKQRFLWQRPRLAHYGSTGRSVSFAKTVRENGYSSHSDTSRSDDSRPTSPDSRSRHQLWSPDGVREGAFESSWRMIDRQLEATWRQGLGLSGVKLG